MPFKGRGAKLGVMSSGGKGLSKDPRWRKR